MCIKNPNALYLHIPFCQSKCPYCDFLSFQNLEKEHKKYTEYLMKEIELYAQNNFETIYFGGGTPSILDLESLKKILNLFDLKKATEITIETNPNISNSKIRALKNMGFNRLSIGFQTFSTDLQKVLSRQYCKIDLMSSYKNFRNLGFENINLDFMFAIPDQKMHDVEKDLEYINQLKPEHISYYSLIWEKNTLFYYLEKKGKLKKTDNDLEYEMFKKIIDTLKKIGYNHYEISNFCQKGYEAKHNANYWKNREYVGVGLGSSGFVNGVRYKNFTKLPDYYESIENQKKPIMERETISELTNGENEIILGLRLLNKGIAIKDEKFLKIANNLVREGMLKLSSGNFVLSEKGLYLANDVFASFLF